MFKFKLMTVILVLLSQNCFSAIINVVDDTSHVHESIHGTDTINILSGGEVAFLSSYDSTNINVQSGGHISHLHTYDNSQVSLSSGSDISHSSAYGNSHFEVNGGDVGFLSFFDFSTANLHQMDGLSWLILGSNTNIKIFGSNFLLSGSHLSGNWENGDNFKFWLLSGEHQSIPANLVRGVIPENLELVNSVPEPSTALLFLSALLPLSFFNKKKFTKP